MMRCRFLLIAALMSTAPLLAQSGQLVEIGTNASGARLSADIGSLRPTAAIAGQRPFDAVQLWVVYDLQGVRRDPARTERALYSFDCKRRLINTLAYQRYRADGRKLHDWRAADFDFKYEAVKAGTLSEQAMNFACSGGKLPRPVQDMGALTPVDEDDE